MEVKKVSHEQARKDVSYWQAQTQNDNISKIRLNEYIDQQESNNKKQTPKKPLDGGSDSFGLCPVCKHDLGHTNYCDECGQAIDWSK